jgi:hypothetical protein
MNSLQIQQELKIRQNLRAMPYQRFLITSFWRSVREIALERAKHRCQLCNSASELQVHHRTYKNRGWEDQHLDDLTVLCANCHKKHHDIVANPKLADKEAQDQKGWREPHFSSGDVTMCRPMTSNELRLFRVYRAHQGLGAPEPYELTPAFHAYWDSLEQRQAKQGIKSWEELEYGL